MAFKSDIEIAQEAEMLPITKIAEQVGLTEDMLDAVVARARDLAGLPAIPTRR